MEKYDTILVRPDNAVSAIIEMQEFSCERASVISYSHIQLSGQDKWNGAGIEATTGGDAVSVDPKYKDVYSTQIQAVILAVNNNLILFTDCSGGVSRRQVILYFPEIIPANERDPQLKEKIQNEMVIIVCQLMQRFSQSRDACALL